MRAGELRQLVAIEQKTDGGEWLPYFEWYCAITQTDGDGSERRFQLEGRWRAEWETLAALRSLEKGYRAVWPREQDVVRYLYIGPILLPERRGDAVVVTCSELVA